MDLESLLHLRFYTGTGCQAIHGRQVLKNLYGFNTITRLSMPVATSYRMVGMLHKSPYPDIDKVPNSTDVAGFPILGAVKDTFPEKKEFRGL